MKLRNNAILSLYVYRGGCRPCKSCDARIILLIFHKNFENLEDLNYLIFMIFLLPNKVVSNYLITTWKGDSGAGRQRPL